MRHRVDGAHPVDEFGFDPEFNSSVLVPAALALYRNWFRVSMRGLEHIPSDGPALIVANHSGVFPLDAIMLQAGIFADHPAHRSLRLLGADLVYAVPGLRTLARKGGHVRADPAQACALLERGEVVGVFPEGFKGIGKRFHERYQLQRFGRGGFARTAIDCRVPIVGCAIVGAEETYPMIANLEPLARLLHLPYFPVTPLFPVLGPLGLVPLPSKWIIEFCPPITAGDLAEPGQDQARLVAALADRVRDIIGAKLSTLLDERGAPFG